MAKLIGAIPLNINDLRTITAYKEGDMRKRGDKRLVIINLHRLAEIHMSTSLMTTKLAIWRITNDSSNI